MDPLFAHQEEALRRMAGRYAFALFMDQGTGKTRIVLEEACRLFHDGKLGGLLVVAQNGVHVNWRDEVARWFDGPAAVHVWRGMTTKREREAYEAVLDSEDFAVLTMNIEALRTRKGEETATRFLRSRRCMMVVDESTRIKTPSAKQTKAALRVGRAALIRRILTGTPATESPLDLYAQCAFLDPDLLGFRSYYAFRNRYAVTRQRHIPGRRPFTEVVGYQRQDELRERLARFSYRVTKSECLDLPEKLYKKRYVELSKQQRAAYARLVESIRAEIAGQRVTTANALTKLLRLQQAVGGFLGGDDGEIVPLDAGPRLEAAREIVEGAPGKVIVWARFRAELEALYRELREFGVVRYHGDVPPEERDEAVRRFQEDDGIRVFVANQQCAGYGLTLTAATTVVYYSNSFSLEQRLQSEDRAHRIGTKHPVLYVDLVAEGTIDERIVRALRSKRDLAATLTGDELREWL